MFWAYGDSKTIPSGYPPTLEAGLDGAISEGVGKDITYVPGATTAVMAGTVAADIASLSFENNLRWILINLGANDVSGVPVEAAWKADMGTILDAMNARWPLAKVYVMRPWRRGKAAECNNLATWIGDLVAARAPWAALGPDERVFLENGDNGVTYTSDGIHPNAAGYVLTAAQWQTVLGY